MALASTAATAQQSNDTAAEISASTISVTSAATAEIEPDKVVILLAVETVGQNISSAVEANSRVANDAIEALLQAGVGENETSTSNFAIYPNYDYNYTEFGYPGDTGEVTDYTVANTIQIESANLENVGSWIDAAVGAGANRVDNIMFTLSDGLLQETKAGLIDDAVEKAETRAGLLASALDMEILGLKDASLDDYD